ncbi:MAG: phenylacetate-CoA oxygenase subunit PaaC [Bdellovibrionales bacterium]|nr:phenylacetate-CoA oxygenase subunit PaaC [Bdellovibrionales bacterium]
MSTTLDQTTREALFAYILRLGDDSLICGHRLSEWCGHAPFLEEDIALANIALDCIGHAAEFLRIAGEVEGKGRDMDKLAYFRTDREYKNLLLLEQPRGDFAETIAKQFFYDTYSLFLYEALTKCAFKDLADMATKALKETKYHFRHSREWVLRLGDGTPESHDKIQNAVNYYWRYTPELFYRGQVDQILTTAKVIPELESIEPEWTKTVSETLTAATLILPAPPLKMIYCGREGKHSEHLGHLLAEMQILPRTYPNATW